MKRNVGMLMGMAMMMSAGMDNNIHRGWNESESSKKGSNGLNRVTTPKTQLEGYLAGLEKFEKSRVEWGNTSSPKLKFIEVESEMYIKGTNVKNAKKRWRKWLGEHFHTSSMTFAEVLVKISDLNEEVNGEGRKSPTHEFYSELFKDGKESK